MAFREALCTMGFLKDSQVCAFAKYDCTPMRLVFVSYKLVIAVEKQMNRCLK